MNIISKWEALTGWVREKIPQPLDGFLKWSLFHRLNNSSDTCPIAPEPGGNLRETRGRYRRHIRRVESTSSWGTITSKKGHFSTNPKLQHLRVQDSASKHGLCSPIRVQLHARISSRDVRHGLPGDEHYLQRTARVRQAHRTFSQPRHSKLYSCRRCISSTSAVCISFPLLL